MIYYKQIRQNVVKKIKVKLETYNGNKYKNKRGVINYEIK